MNRQHHSVAAAAAIVAVLALLPALGGCISRHALSLPGLKAQPEQQLGKTVEFTLADGEQDTMVLEGVNGDHAFGQSRGLVKHVDLNEVVKVQEHRINPGAVVGAIMGVVAVAAAAVGVTVAATDTKVVSKELGK